jgi:hypothetical protein
LPASGLVFEFQLSLQHSDFIFQFLGFCQKLAVLVFQEFSVLRWLGSIGAQRAHRSAVLINKAKVDFLVSLGLCPHVHSACCKEQS